MASLSVVIAAKNCADRIEGTVKPWLGLASEIIVVDQNSFDATAQKAEALGCRILINTPADGNFDLNRKLGMESAKGDWILYIDTDERPSAELLNELKDFLGTSPVNVAGVRIPNHFYFLGKALKHGLYDPKGAEIRLVCRGKWSYPCEAGFHRGVSVEGPVVHFKSAYRHFNVNTLSEWFIKTNQYTEHDADKWFQANKSGTSVQRYGVFFNAFRFFIRHYFFKFGFLDGFHGLVSIFYFMLYHLTLNLKKWERVALAEKKEGADFLCPISQKSR